MKFEPSNKPVKFTPITVTLETPDEVAFLYATVTDPSVRSVLKLSDELGPLLALANKAAGNEYENDAFEGPIGSDAASRKLDAMSG